MGFTFLFIFCLFVCILLHELGHSLTAKRYGIVTRDIILSPIGGLARLERIPDNPWKEFFVALNGPVVNLILALILGLIIFVIGLPFPSAPEGKILIIDQSNFLHLLLALNVMVCIFNLIPAFPMDGGRILRALLSIKLGRVSATMYASWIGKIFATGFMLFAAWNGLFLFAIVGMFVYFMAGYEYRQVKINASLQTTKLSDILRAEFTKVFDRYQIADFLQMPKVNEEDNFLVFDEYTGQVTGSIPYLFVEEMKTDPDQLTPIRDLKSKRFGFLKPDNTILDAYNYMSEGGMAIIGIRTSEEEELLGVVDRTAIQNFITALPKHRIIP